MNKDQKNDRTKDRIKQQVKDFTGGRAPRHSGSDSGGFVLDAEVVLRIANYVMWALALALLAHLVAASPALAQQAPDTCAAGGSAGGAGEVLDALGRLVTFGTLALAAVGAVGFLAAGAMKMMGALSERMQYLGNAGIGGVLVGLGIGFGATIIIRLAQWIVCNTG